MSPDTQTVRCADCGTELTPGVPGACPDCGSDRRNVEVSVTLSVGVELSGEWAVSASNGTEARVRHLQQALDELDVNATGDVHAVQLAVKHALEALHELDDGRRERTEWTQTGWSADDIGLWVGLMGARNASHHTNSPVVMRHGGNERPAEERVVWQLDPTAVAELHSADQQREYTERVHDHPARAQLDQALALVREVT